MQDKHIWEPSVGRQEEVIQGNSFTQAAERRLFHKRSTQVACGAAPAASLLPTLNDAGCCLAPSWDDDESPAAQHVAARLLCLGRLTHVAGAAVTKAEPIISGKAA